MEHGAWSKILFSPAVAIKLYRITVLVVAPMTLIEVATMGVAAVLVMFTCRCRKGTFHDDHRRQQRHVGLRNSIITINMIADDIKMTLTSDDHTSRMASLFKGKLLLASDRSPLYLMSPWQKIKGRRRFPTSEEGV